MDESEYETFFNSNYQSKSQKRKRVSIDKTLRDDEIITSKCKQFVAFSSKQWITSSSKQSVVSSSKQPVASSSGVSVTSREALFQFKDELAIQQKAPPKLDQAIHLLYANYESWLDFNSFVHAMNLFTDEQKASMFLVMKPGNKNDWWLKLQLDIELDPLNIE